ncbi:MAG TPA: kelch repeat-containing protein [Candidatus Sulfotelmatobacter sp.]|jgi:N-acetylneuraminic acid mutarotase
MKSYLFVLMLGTALFSTGCGGGSGSAPANVVPPVTYTVGGSISGLAGTGLVLQNNKASSVTVSANATAFTFPTAVTSGSAYNVSVMTQPSSPAQNCVVSGGSGMTSANVTSVLVTCSTTPTNYTVGGTISGLSGSGLVLQDNNGDNLTINASQATFTFATALTNGTAYSVSVLTQPSNPIQNCTVNSASGTSSANLTTVAVACANLNEWTWENGPNVVDQIGEYGTLGLASSSNLPGARYWSVSSGDPSGNFWLFGGYGYDSLGTVADLNDLWEYMPSTGQWVSMGGAKVAGVGGTYGTLASAGLSNMPGARDSAVSWTDASGNFWLFGGHGYDSTRSPGNLNDLWEYNPSAGWTWVSGADVVNQSGIYGTQGIADAGNVPGSRYSSISWVDKKGNFWLFGGLGYDSASTVGYLNDLWKGSYNSAGQWTWTWVSGSNVAGVNGTYGTQALASSSNAPGARFLSASWTDKQGNLWLFGGFGPDSAGNTAVLSDLWKFNIGSGQWIWVGGSEIAAEPGVYGTLGVGASTNLPGSRKGPVVWTDSIGNFWLFGGIGIDSAGIAGELNDLWEYNPSTAKWTWQSGSNLAGEAGNYGTLGMAAVGNVPGARGGSPAWSDAEGNLWLFGGNGPISGVNGSFSDLWKFVP